MKFFKHKIMQSISIIQDIVLVSRKKHYRLYYKKIYNFLIHIYFDFLFQALTNNNLQGGLQLIGAYFVLNKPVQNDQYEFIGQKNFLF